MKCKDDLSRNLVAMNLGAWKWLAGDGVSGEPYRRGENPVRVLDLLNNE